MSRRKARNAIIVIASALVGVGLGFVVGKWLQQPSLSIALGVLSGVPIGLAIASGRWRWVGIAMIADALILLLYVGQWLALGLALVICAATFFASACSLSEFYGGNELAAFRGHLSLILRGVRETQEIEGGKTLPPSKTKKQQDGPRRIRIPPGNALVLIKRHQHIQQPPAEDIHLAPSHVLEVQGPKTGECVVRATERVVAVYDLREKQSSYSFDMVQTSSGVTTTVRIAVTSCLDVREAARQGDIELSAIEKDSLRHLAMTLSDSESILKSAVENSVRLTIGALPAMLLLSGQSYPFAEKRILELSNGKLNPQGIRVCRVTIEGVQR